MNKKITIPITKLALIYLKHLAIVSIPLLIASLGLFYGIINLENQWYELAACFVTVVLFVVAKLYIDERVENEIKQMINEKYTTEKGETDGK